MESRPTLATESRLVSAKSGDGTGENLLRRTGRDHSFRRDGSDSDQGDDAEQGFDKHGPVGNRQHVRFLVDLF